MALTNDDMSTMVRSLARTLGVEATEVDGLREQLAARGITNRDDLFAEMRARNRNSGRPNQALPAVPEDSLSPLYSDIEIRSTCDVDSVITDIAVVGIGLTVDTTLAKLPVRWAFTDFMASGNVLASGFTYLIEIQILIGTTIVTRFRLDAMSKAEKNTLVQDAFDKLYKYNIGPLSTVTIRTINYNTGAGQTFTGYFHHTYRVLAQGLPPAFREYNR